MKVAFHTLGCKLNYAETSTLARAFEQRAFEVVGLEEAMDVAVINTCSVTEEADRKCRQVIRRALRANPEAFVVVTGCYAQLRPEAIARIPGVDYVLGSQEKFLLFNLIESFTKRDQTQVRVSCIDEAPAFGAAYSAGERTRSFLKIQDGCDYSCSFCTIPLARGRSRSAAPDDVVVQAREIAARGVREIVLTGVNIGLYGLDNGESLLPLLRRLDDVEGIRRYRISSIEPNLLTDDIIAFTAGSRAFQPHFHIPLQSGDDEVLGKMRRRYRRDVYAGRVETIKRLMPHACIGADVIVGFPAETEAHFENTFAFLSDLPVSYLHAFTYSERPDTTAVDHLDRLGGTPVPKSERAHRNKRLRLLSEKKRAAFYLEHQGGVRPVLWEGSEKAGLLTGFTDNYIKVSCPADRVEPGEIEYVRLGAMTEFGTLQAEDAALVSLL